MQNLRILGFIGVAGGGGGGGAGARAPQLKYDQW